MEVIKRRIIALLGPQGSGKDTQAQLLAEHTGYPILTMSAMLRTEVATASERGKMIDKIIREGKLTPAEITNELIKKRLEDHDTAFGALINGYPRNRAQYEAFEYIAPPTDVVFLDINNNLAIQRIAGRRICECGRIYHMEWNPPKNNEICDACGKKLVQRDDDTPEAVRERLRIYHEESETVIELYRKRGIVHQIDASRAIHMIHEDILKALKLL